MLVFVASLWAQSQPADAPADKPATTTKKAVAKKPVARKPAAKPVAKKPSEVVQLREEVAAQQRQIQQLKDDLNTTLQQMQQQMKSLQSSTATAAQTAQGAAQTAQSAAAATQSNTTAVSQVQATVNTLAATETKTETTVQATEKRIRNLEEPVSITYKGIKLTPSGYLQFATIDRTKNMNSDTADKYGSVPLNNTANAYMSEFRASGRASRIAFKAEAAPKNLKVMGYVEMDFLGAATDANETQSNSYTPRLRLAFANVDFPSGWSIAGGQNWSMIQTTRKGIDPLSEWLPSLIDNSYTPGFSYAREGTIRVVKKLAPGYWMGLSVENPATVSSVSCVQGTTLSSSKALTSCASAFTGGAIQGLQNGPNTASPSSGFANVIASGTTTAGNPSTNVAPDFVVKFAAEPGWGHYEVKAIGRFFRDRIYPNYQTSSTVVGANTLGATNKTTEGFGVGFGAILPLVKNKIDFDYQTLVGKGIGRFGTTSGPDVTIRPDGTLVPIKAVQMVAGFETHVTPKFDFNIYAGGDYYGRTTYMLPTGSTTQLFGAAATASNLPVITGYGSPYFSNSQCNIEGASTCAGNNRYVWAVQPQIWYRLYRGKEGTVQIGASYAYVYRRSWSGLSAASTVSSTSAIGGPLTEATGINNIIMTSFRYYLP
jgi:hypothetical protein